MTIAPTMTHAQLTRMIWIDARLVGSRTLNRSDIMTAFGVSIVQAAADLKRYQSLNPGRLRYDRAARIYRTRTGSSPAFTASLRLAVTHAINAITDYRMESTEAMP